MKNSAETIYGSVRVVGNSIVVKKYTTTREVNFSPQSVRMARASQALEGLVTVVVGAGLGNIGGAVAKEAALQGSTVVTVSRDKEGAQSVAQQLVEELRSLGSQDSFWIGADITDEKGRERIIGQTAEKLGRIDRLVIATAELKDSFFLRMDLGEKYRQIWETNFFGPVFLLQDVTKQMRRQELRGGKVVVISSLAGTVAPGQTEYGPAKAGLDNVIQSVPLEDTTGRLYPDIFFNAVAPGLVDTKMVAHLSKELEDFLLRNSRADRKLLPQEVAELVVHLLDPQTKANGQVVSLIGIGETPLLDNLGFIPR